MMAQLKLLPFLFLIGISLNAQSIPDSEFTWTEKYECAPNGISSNIFVKVEKDPVITQFTVDQFELFVDQLVHKLLLPEDQIGILKLKILFKLDQELCLYKIGTQILQLKEWQKTMLFSEINSISEFENGTQRNIPVNCQAILYINISKGQMEKFRLINFNFG